MSDDAQTDILEVMAAAPPAALFQGYNSVLGNGLSTAVTGKSVDSGARSKVQCSVSISIEEVAQSLGIDQSLSVSFGKFGGIDEKMKFMNSLKVTTCSVSVTVFARHIIRTRTATDFRFEGGIAVPKPGQELKDFVRYYGDSFLSSVTEGGEYIAVYTFYSQTKEEQSDLVVSMKASGIFDGTTVDGGLQTAMNNFLKKTNIRSSFCQQVSGIKDPVLPQPTDVVNYAVKFPSIALDAPELIGFKSTGYEEVPSSGAVFQPVAENRDYFIGDSIIDGLTAKLVTISQIDNQMYWLMSTYRFYGGYHDEALEKNQDIAKRDINRIHDQMTQYKKNPTGEFTLPPLKSLDNGTPALKYDIYYTDPWGGGGGSPFQDVDERSYIQNHARISALKLRSGAYVDQINTTYQDERGSQAATHGGKGGGESNTLQLMEGQFVTTVEGRCGSLVDQLKLTITGGRSVGGGGGGGSPFSWSVPDGSFVLGFQGRCGGLLDRIQVVYARFKPAEWVPVA